MESIFASFVLLIYHKGFFLIYAPTSITLFNTDMSQALFAFSFPIITACWMAPDGWRTLSPSPTRFALATLKEGMLLKNAVLKFV